MKRSKYTILLLLLMIAGFNGYSQKQLQDIYLSWNEPVEMGLEGSEKKKVLNFDEAQYDYPSTLLPFYYLQIAEGYNQSVSGLTIQEIQFEKLTEEEAALIQKSSAEISRGVSYEIHNAVVRKQNVSYLKLSPFRLNENGQIEKLISLKYDINLIKDKLYRQKAQMYAANSVLRSGDWFKVGVAQDGVYKLSYNFLNNLGLDINNIDPRNIRIYGNGGGMLPALNSAPRNDDLIENPIQVIGESDGKFDKGDYVLFYGEGQVEWKYDSTKDRFSHTLNTYSDTTYYFITADLGKGKRIMESAAPADAPTYTTNQFDDYKYHERDLVNLLNSGSTWFGETFNDANPLQFNFDFPNLVTSSPASFEISAAGRAGKTSYFYMNVANKNFSMPIGATILNRYEMDFATMTRDEFTFTPTANPISLKVSYSKPQAVSKGWLNYINVNARRKLIHTGMRNL